VRLDLVDAVTRAARLVQAEPLATREVHVLSDLQASALAGGRAARPEDVAVLVLAPTDPVANRGVAVADVRDGAVAVTVGGTAGAPAGAVGSWSASAVAPHSSQEQVSPAATAPRLARPGRWR
jgi:hypothetical protein